MTTPPDSSGERAAFEKWGQDIGLPLLNLSRRPYDDAYSERETRCAWASWQAARRAPSASDEPRAGAAKAMSDESLLAKVERAITENVTQEGYTKGELRAAAVACVAILSPLNRIVGDAKGDAKPVAWAIFPYTVVPLYALAPRAASTPSAGPSEGMKRCERHGWYVATLPGCATCAVLYPAGAAQPTPPARDEAREVASVAASEVLGLLDVRDVGGRIRQEAVERTLAVLPAREGLTRAESDARVERAMTTYAGGYRRGVEDAAKVCDGMSEKLSKLKSARLLRWDDGGPAAARQCAADIRALAPPDGARDARDVKEPT